MNEATSKDQNSTAPTVKPSRRLPRDRYIAPEMADWTKSSDWPRRAGAAHVNDSKPMFSDWIQMRTAIVLCRTCRSSRSARSVPRNVFRFMVSAAQIDKVYSSDKATSGFGHFRRAKPGVCALNLSTVSRRTEKQEGFWFCRICNAPAVGGGIGLP